MDDHEQQPPKRRLGRGLNALIGSGAVRDSGDAPPPDDSTRSEIHIELIERNPFQPRRDFDQPSINELADSIRHYGILQPLLVRPHGDIYQLVAGERRMLAARKAGIEVVPCRVLDFDDRQVCEVALEENLKRKDLSDLEKAQAFHDYINRFSVTVDELAKRLSLDRSTVSNFVRLLELPEPVKADLQAGRISAGHARALLPLEQADQIAACTRIQADSLSVRQTEQLVRSIQKGAGEGTVPFESEPDPNPALTNHVLSLEEQLRGLLGIKVEIKLKGRGREAGKVILHFANNDEFERIVSHVRRAA